MRKFKKYILLIFCIVPGFIFAQNRNHLLMNDLLLKDNFEIVIHQKNKLEKKGDILFLELSEPDFFIVENGGVERHKTSIPMVGSFQKYFTHTEVQELKGFATTVLSHPLWLTDNDRFGTSIKITQDEKSVFGKIKTTPPYDKDIAVFLEKQNAFFTSQLVNVNKYTPIKAIQVSHSIEIVKNKIVVKLHIKNIGKEKIQLKNPLELYSSTISAPHLWYAAIFQVFNKNEDNSEPDFSFTFKEENIEFNGRKISKLASMVEINPKEEQTFTFKLTPEEENQIPNGQYNARITLAFPFDAVGMQRVVISTAQKRFIKNFK